MRNWIYILFVNFLLASGHAAVDVVADFGAVGNAQQYYVSTTSNSVLVVANSAIAAPIVGDSMEILGCGKQVYGQNSYGTNAFGYTDLIATITNVVNVTNLYVNRLPSQTFANQFATSGHNNTTNFQAAFNSVSGTNYTINIPSGNYLLLATNYPSAPLSDPTSYYSCYITNGGWHLVGQGTNSTRLIGQCAWQQLDVFNGTSYSSNTCVRGKILAIYPHTPFNNNYPVSISDMMLDGGVTNGNTDIHGTYANNYDGQGWDITHDAISERGGNAQTITTMTWSNLLIAHWRGEQVKSNGQTTNGNLTVVDCRFSDGNATAINFYYSTVWTNCFFDNLFQVGEYYQQYSTNQNVMENCIFTNIYQNGFAINGGSYSSPAFIIRNNKFYFHGYNNIGILTLPACNVFIYSNLLSSDVSAINHFTGVDFGATGYQGTSCNSNIWVYDNTFTNISNCVGYGVGSAPTGTNLPDSNYSINIHILRNFVTGATNLNPTVASGNGYSLNVDIQSNSVDANVKNSTAYQSYATFTSGGRGEPIVLVSTNNLYWSYIYNLNAGASKAIQYNNGGCRFGLTAKYYTNSYYYLADSNQIPSGAQIIITNLVTENGAGTTVPIVSQMSASPATNYLALGQVLSFFWTGTTWSTNAVAIARIAFNGGILTGGTFQP